MTTATGSRQLLVTPLDGGAVTKESLFEGRRISRRYMNEPDFRDYPRLLDEQAENIFAMTDDVGASAQHRQNALRSISDISQRQCLKNSNEEFVARNEDE